MGQGILRQRDNQGLKLLGERAGSVEDEVASVERHKDDEKCPGFQFAEARHFGQVTKTSGPRQRDVNSSRSASPIRKAGKSFITHSRHEVLHFTFRILLMFA
jgi:hypothetical protein